MKEITFLTMLFSWVVLLCQSFKGKKPTILCKWTAHAEYSGEIFKPKIEILKHGLKYLKMNLMGLVADFRRK